MPTQLPLQFDFQTNQTFSTFYTGTNDEILTHLKNVFHTEEPQIYIWGTSGTGKTHLLQATSQLTDSLNKTAFYYCFTAKKLPHLTLLRDLDTVDLVCFDNIQVIAGHKKWELAFFNFFNRHRENNKKLVLSANCPPQHLQIQLADLQTRMSWGLTLRLHTIPTDQQLDALIYKANDLGFEISPTVGRFLISHYEQDLSTIWTLIETINDATLSAKRKLTIPFLKQWLAQ